MPAASATVDVTAPLPSDIHIELTRGGTQSCVLGPSTQAASCAAWLRELVRRGVEGMIRTDAPWLWPPPTGC